MVIISTVTANTNAGIRLQEEPGTRLYDVPARVGRTRTLDGGVVIVHNGVVHGDRTLRVRSTLSEAETLLLRAIYEQETEVTLSSSVGLFRGAIESLGGDGGQIDLSFFIKEKLA